MTKDSVSELYHHAHRNKWTVQWRERSEGPDHEKTFFMRAVIDGKAYSWRSGRQKKIAKHRAARIALSCKMDQNWNPKTIVTSVDSVDDEDGGSPEESPQWSEEKSQPNSSAIFEDTSNSPKAQRACPPARSAPKTRQKPEDRKKGQNAKPQAVKRHSAEHQDSTKCKRKCQGPLEASRFTTEFDSISFLGSGGFSAVFKARHKRLDQFFAVKIALSDEDSLREVKALSKLHHDHIIRYYSCWEEDEGYEWRERVGKFLPKGSVDYSKAKFLYIQMEVCTETLSDLIEKKNAETLTDFQRAEEFLPIFLQIVKGLEFIHLNKKIHRDLKPSNILRGQNDLMKIADFGLVTMNDDSERTRNRGTETYMAPEQKCGKNYDHKVDMFPLGLIFLEMIYKVSSGHERGKVLGDARNQKLPEKCSLFKEFKLIRKLLSLDPKDRPEASEVRAEVESWIQREPRRNTTV